MYNNNYKKSYKQNILAYNVRVSNIQNQSYFRIKRSDCKKEIILLVIVMNRQYGNHYSVLK